MGDGVDSHGNGITWTPEQLQQHIDRARIAEQHRMENETDPEERRLRDKVAAFLGSILPGHILPHTSKRISYVSVWYPDSLTGHTTIIVQVGRKYISEVYSRRSVAGAAIGILGALEEAGFELGPNIIKAREKWAAGRTLASKGFDL